jgi:protein transport protein SEC61 subunit gamma and related proteins
MFNVKSFIAQCARVWQILKKPDVGQYKTTAKVAAVGILLIGLLGFIVSFITNLLPV